MTEVLKQMMKVKRIILLGAALLAACDEELVVGSDDAELISANNLDWNNLSANWVETRTLFGSRMAQSPASAQLASTTGGRNVLTYLVRCALQASARVTVRDNSNAPVTFWGNDNVYAGWPAAAPQRQDAECLAGCVAAHLNGLNMRVDISLRGESCGYPVTRQELGDSQVEEGAFGGDNELHFYACVGDGLKSACGNSAAPTLAARICTSGDPRCGNVTILGDCRNVCTGKSATGAYTGCKVGNSSLTGMTTVWLEGGIPYPCVF
jgi:hypothetical protein